MKRIPVIVCLLAILFSCEKTEIRENRVFRARTVSPSGTDNAVNSWTFLLFDIGNGSLRHIARGTSTDMSCTVKKGSSYIVHALVNSPVETTPAHIDGYLQTPVPLQDNCEGNLVMWGQAVFTADAGIGNVGISLSRLVSRIRLMKINLSFTDATLLSKTFTLKSVYLTGVYTRMCPGDTEALSSGRYNLHGYHASGENRLLDEITSAVGIDSVLVSGTSYNTEHCFYTYPHSGDSPTRIVIEAQLGNKTYYYPVSFPTMERNVSYNITNVTICGYGALDPDGEVPGAVDVTIEISRDTWDKSCSVSEIS